MNVYGRSSAANHDFAQSVNVFELLGERYQAALSELALGRVLATYGSRQSAARHLDQAEYRLHGPRRRTNLEDVALARAALMGWLDRRTLPAPAWKPTMRWSGGWWMPRSSPSCWPARRRLALIESLHAETPRSFRTDPGRRGRPLLGSAGATAPRPKPLRMRW